jgi:predicted  nucleic acid-binding Zn-ribbon protein
LEAQFGYANEGDYIPLAVDQGLEWEQGLSAHIAQQKAYVDQLTDDPASYEPHLEGGTLSPIEQAKATLTRLEDDLRDLKNDQEALTTSTTRHDIEKEQNMNNNISAADSRSQLARLETAHLQELITAGADETAFGQAFDRLQSNLSMSEKELAGIAAAYGAGTDGRTDRRSVLGAIEARFYSAARAATHTQQRANGRGR